MNGSAPGPVVVEVVEEVVDDVVLVDVEVVVDELDVAEVVVDDVDEVELDVVEVVEDVVDDVVLDVVELVVEEEDEDGHTRLSVIVSPDVGEIDENEVIKTVLAELSQGPEYRRTMAEVWSQSKTLRVKRMQPITTARGKLLPLHIHKGK